MSIYSLSDIIFSDYKLFLYLYRDYDIKHHWNDMQAY